MEKKRLFALLLAVLAIFALASCGGAPAERKQSKSVDRDWNAEQEELNAAELQENRKVPPDAIESSNNLMMIIDDVELSLDGNDLTIQVHLLPNLPADWLKHIRMAWYLMQEQETLITEKYGVEQYHTFPGLEPGQYRIKYYLRYRDGERDIRKSFFTRTITVSGPDEESGSKESVDAVP